MKNQAIKEVIKFRKLEDIISISLSIFVIVSSWGICWFFKESLGADWWAWPFGIGILMGGVLLLVVTLYRQDCVAEKRIASLEQLQRSIRRHTQKEALIHQVMQSLQKIFDFEQVALYLKKKPDENYHLVYRCKAGQKELSPRELPSYWKSETQLTRQLKELIHSPTQLCLIEQKSHPETKNESALKEEMERLNTSIVVGIVTEERLEGLLCLGWPKEWLLEKDELSELDILVRWFSLKLQRFEHLEPLQPWVRLVQFLGLREKAKWS